MSAQTSKFTRAAKMAKKLYKSGRYKKYSDAVRAAFKRLPGKSRSKPKRRKVGATLLLERKETRRTKPKRIVRVERTKSGLFNGMQSISGAKQTMKTYYADKLKNALYKRDQASTKRLKKVWGKLITEYRGQLKKYSS